MASLDTSLSAPVQEQPKSVASCGWGVLAYPSWKRWARAIVSIRATPKQVALGMAIGSFIAFSPLIGLQTLLAALAATLMGASKKAAMLAVWISNPLTMGPIFAVTYQLGVLMGSPSPAMATVPGGGTVEVSGAEIPVGALTVSPYSLEWLMQSGWGYILPMFLGGAVVGLLAAFLAYHLTHRGVLAYQAVHSRRQHG